MDNVKANQQRRGSLSPSLMPRTLWSTGSPTKDLQTSGDYKGVNVKVVLRCRPLNEDEIKAKTSVVISCDDLKQEVTAKQNTSYKQVERSFVFDKVFGPTAQQKELYDTVVAPIVSDVLEGYSWTIFAYGQTGTGKTYTMEGGGGKEKNGQFHVNAGVIPRAVQQIFHILDGEKADYSMKVTFLELYNEEITDLLIPEDGTKKSLVLVEDGKGSVFVRGLEEEIVCTADEIYAILNKGSARKHVAETLLNKQSNRSHSILTITIQIKESCSDGSELIKCGKLNLVDLAGSENILRFGVKEIINARAREAGEINKSLLTLGRVINALAENSAHVPYRESKLTRLLRDSLGGKTKTCVIATVSPSILSQEETLGTLEYAFRAKSIKNRPEVNHKVKKATLLKDLYTQIGHLKQELRSKGSNGFYAPQENQHGEEATRKKLVELQELYMDQQQLTEDLKDKLESTQRELTKTRQSLIYLEDQYQQATKMNKDKENLMFNAFCSGKTLAERTLELRSDLEEAASDVSTLFTRIEKKNSLEDRNKLNIQNFYSQLTQQLHELDEVVSASVTRQEQNLKMAQDKTESFITSKAAATNELLKQIQNLKDLYTFGIRNLDNSAEAVYRDSQLSLSRLSSDVSARYSCIMDAVMKSSLDSNMHSEGLKLNLKDFSSRLSVFMEMMEENHAKTYRSTKSISQSLLNFFETLKIYISKMTLMQEDSGTITNQKINTFTEKLEEFSLSEEKVLVQQMVELLADSRSRKKKLIQATVSDILDSVGKRTEELNQEMSKVQCFSNNAEDKWNDYIERTEADFIEDSIAFETGKSTLGEDFSCCLTKSTDAGKHCSVTKESILELLKRNAESVDTCIKNEKEGNVKIHTQFSTVLSTLLAETDDAGRKTVLSVNYPMQLENEASEHIRSSSSCFLKDMKEMNNIHSEKVVKISGIARKSLVDDYLVEGSSDLSPIKRNFNLPSKEYIENIMNGWLGNSMESLQPDTVAQSIPCEE